MKTTSVMIQNLCVPCANRCRYCLLSCSGSAVGAEWERGEALARRMTEELSKSRPELRVSFSAGYSCEFDDIPARLASLRALSSPQAEFWQCDGMRMRDEAECEALAETLANGGVKHLNFTFYGLPGYHDLFAARKGDHSLMRRMMRAGADQGLKISCGIALTRESAPQTDELIALLRETAECGIRLFIPHSEGRGIAIEPIRITEGDMDRLSDEAKRLLNAEYYKSEARWLGERPLPDETERALLISIRADNIERYEGMAAEAIAAETEALDEAYYAAFPRFDELAGMYGDPEGEAYFSRRDLFARYRRMYAAERGATVYDVTDERLSGSRRY